MTDPSSISTLMGKLKGPSAASLPSGAPTPRLSGTGPRSSGRFGRLHVRVRDGFKISGNGTSALPLSLRHEIRISTLLDGLRDLPRHHPGSCVDGYPSRWVRSRVSQRGGRPKSSGRRSLALSDEYLYVAGLRTIARWPATLLSVDGGKIRDSTGRSIVTLKLNEELTRRKR